MFKLDSMLLAAILLVLAVYLWMVWPLLMFFSKVAIPSMIEEQEKQQQQPSKWGM